jgi:hypothetical protein
MAGRSRVNREVQARICGGLEVKFLRSTRLSIFAILQIPNYQSEFSIAPAHFKSSFGPEHF